MDAAKKREIAFDLHNKLVAYWHDVDFNWGLNAASYYTEDGVFESGGVAPYTGRGEIEEFYAFRRDRGARVALHAIVNFRCEVESETSANGAWVCMLYAHDGEAPQPTAPPINVSLVKDVYVLQDGEWLVKRRTWNGMFKGGAAATVLSRDEMEKRLASKKGG
jgi:hypothetical protein